MGFNTYARMADNLSTSKDLIESNLKLVMCEAHKYTRYGIEYEDLVQQGNIGLIKAAEKFNPNKGARFSTYAGIWIRKYIKDSLYKGMSNTVHQSSNFKNRTMLVNKVIEKFKKQFDREPTIEEIHTEINKNPAAVNRFDIKSIEKVMKHRVQSIVYLNQQIDESSSEKTMEELIGSTEDNIPSIELTELYDIMKELLTPEEIEYIKLRFLEKQSFSAIGKLKNIHPSKIHASINNSLKKLKEKMLE